MDKDTVFLYYIALQQLRDEGDQQAQIAYLAIEPNVYTHQGRSIREGGVSVEQWAANIHDNTWGTNSFGARVKARVVRLRVQGTDPLAQWTFDKKYRRP